MDIYENAIEIKSITKKYDGFTLDNVSFEVPKGSIMGFIGQNGAGKSTTIRTRVRYALSVLCNLFTTGSVVYFELFNFWT